MNFCLIRLHKMIIKSNRALSSFWFQAKSGSVHRTKKIVSRPNSKTTKRLRLSLMIQNLLRSEDLWNLNLCAFWKLSCDCKIQFSTFCNCSLGNIQSNGHHMEIVLEASNDKLGCFLSLFLKYLWRTQMFPNCVKFRRWLVKREVEEEMGNVRQVFL